MSAAFRNFFLSFIICLLLFGYLGYSYAWPMVSDLVDLDDMGKKNESSQPADTSDPGGDDISGDVQLTGRSFTCVFVGETLDGRVGSIVFFRANEATKRFTCVSIPLDTKVINKVGVEVPVSLLLEDADGATVKGWVSSLTGFTADRFARVSFDGLCALLEKLRNPYFDISRAITCVNPKYKSTYFPAGSEPEDYYLNIEAKRQPLDANIAEAILSYTPYTDGTDYRVLTSDLYQSLFVQFMTNSGTKRNMPNLSALLARVDTDISVADLSEYIDIIFTYDEYSLQSVAYPSDWSKAVTALHTADSGR